MPSAFLWPVLVPSALRATAPVNLGVRPQKEHMNRQSLPTLAGACLTLVIAAAPALCYAGPYTDTLSKCLVAGTTTSDKTLLVRWMFSMLSVHPEVQAQSTATAATRSALSKSMAAMVQRLLIQTCFSEAKDALKYEGSASFEGAFTVLGQVAARELSSDRGVSDAMSEYIRYLDSREIGKLEPVR